MKGVCRIEVTDALPRQLINASFNCSEIHYTLDTQSLIPGIYTVRVELENAPVHSEKLVIVR